MFKPDTSLSNSNLYSYCDNNPVNCVDDYGSCWHILGGALIGVFCISKDNKS